MAREPGAAIQANPNPSPTPNPNPSPTPTPTPNPSPNPNPNANQVRLSELVGRTASRVDSALSPPVEGSRADAQALASEAQLQRERAWAARGAS